MEIGQLLHREKTDVKERTINLWRVLAWVFGGLVVSGVVWAGVSGPVPTDSVSGVAIPEKIANGPLVNGYIPVLGYCTSTATGTGTADRLCYKPIPPGLSDGTIQAGSNIVISTGTSTSVGTSPASLADSPKIHAVGFEPAIPAGSIGRAICYTGTGTGTTTSTSKSQCASISDRGVRGVYISNQVQLPNLSGKGAGNVLYDSTGSGDLAARAVTIGAEGFATWKKTVSTGLDTATATASSVNLITDMSPRIFLANVSETPSANYIPIADASGLLDGWISDASASVSGKMPYAHYNMLEAATQTAGTNNVLAKCNPHGYLNNFTPVFSNTVCKTNADMSITTSSVTSVATISITEAQFQDANANKLRLSYHVSGFGDGAEAIAAAWVTVGGTNQACTRTVATVQNGDAAVLSATCEAWDASWDDSGTSVVFQMITTLGTFKSPVNSQSTYYSACLTVNGFFSL